MNPTSTKEVYFQNGQYSEYRQMLHQNIINDLIGNIQPPADQPLVIFLGGGSASGKTSISKLLLQTFADDNEHVIHIDSDAIKSVLPERDSFLQQDPNTAASRLHEESSDIAEALFVKSLEKNINILLDGTMKSAERAERLIGLARSHDYKVSVVVADVSLDEALSRAEKRFIIEQRRVPESVIRESHQMVPMTIKKIENQVDSLYLYDTTERHPNQFYVKDQGEVLRIDEDRLTAFYNKAVIDNNPERWVTPTEPMQLLEVLKEGKGLPTGSQVTAEFLHQKVARYAYMNVNGHETLHYQLQGGNGIKQVRLEAAPYLSPQSRNMLLDQAGQKAFTPIRNLGMEI